MQNYPLALDFQIYHEVSKSIYQPSGAVTDRSAASRRSPGRNPLIPSTNQEPEVKCFHAKLI